MAINTGKVITGGLLAGLVFNVLDITWNFTVLASDGQAMAARLNLDPAVMTDFSYAVPWIIVDFIVGLVVVWTYAAFRPRFGPGPKTAVLAALGPFIAVTAVLYGFASIGVFTMAYLVKSTLLSMVTVPAGSIAGASVYKE